MGETSDEIESHIRDTREDLSANLGELEQKVKSATDWRRLYQKSPGIFLAAAAGGGLLLALMTRSRKPAIAPTVTHWVPPPTAVAKDSHWHGSIADIRSALIGLAASEARNMLHKWVPGLEQRLAEAADAAQRGRTMGQSAAEEGLARAEHVADSAEQANGAPRSTNGRIKPKSVPGTN